MTTTLKVFCTHWSDNHQRWGKPREAIHLSLGMPFGYFLASDESEANELITKLKPLTAVRRIDYFPANFHLGSMEIELISSSKR